MKKRIHGKVYIVWILIFALTLLVPQYHANAAQVGTITISVPEIKGVEVKLYQVATVNENNNMKVADQFKKYGVDLMATTAADTLYHYALRDGLQPMQKAMTNEDGICSFGVLQKGLYLICMGDVNLQYLTFRMSPSLVNMPQEEEWNYTIDAKYYRLDDPTTLTVTKIWTYETEDANRPASITAQLLKDGQVAEEVQLNEDNFWTYTWKNLDRNFEWVVVEKEAVKNYVMTITKEGSLTIIENEYVPDEPYDEPPKKEEKTTVEEEPPGGKLPQTGQPWAQVAGLFAVGLLSLLVGLWLKGRDASK